MVTAGGSSSAASAAGSFQSRVERCQIGRPGSAKGDTQGQEPEFVEGFIEVCLGSITDEVQVRDRPSLYEGAVLSSRGETERAVSPEPGRFEIVLPTQESV